MKQKLVNEIIICFTTLIISYFTFTLLANNLLSPQIKQLDAWVINFIYSFRSPLMNILMVIITSFGGDILVFIAILFLIILIQRKHNKEAILFWFLATFGTLLNQILKYIYQRPRPDNFPLMLLTSYSFPSGHSMISFIFYLSLAYFIYTHLKNKKAGILFFVFAVCLVFAIGISRIYLGVHYPTDVLAGFIAGFAWLCFALMTEKIYMLFRLSKNK